MILELIRRTSRYWVIIRCWKKIATATITGTIAMTIQVSGQEICAINQSAVRILMAAKVTSRSPQVINSATRSVSEVTRLMIQPTGVRL